MLFSKNKLTKPIFSDKIDKNTIFFDEPKLIGANYDLIKLFMQERKQKEEYKHLALYDELTDVLNRHGLKKFFKEFYKNGEYIRIFSIDIKNLTGINKLGYDLGDDAIKTLSDILKDIFSLNKIKNNRHLVCRYGGDEFLVIIPGLGFIDQLSERFLELEKKEIINECNYIVNQILSKVSEEDKNKKYDFGIHIKYIPYHKIENYKIVHDLDSSSLKKLA